jgi:CSLREA domain-containing protein
MKKRCSSRRHKHRLDRELFRPRTGERRLRFEPLEDRRMLAVLTVNSTADNNNSDDFLTLREAILLVNHAGDAEVALGGPLTPGEEAQIDTSESFGTNDTIDLSVTGIIQLSGGFTELLRQSGTRGPGTLWSQDYS